MPKPIVYEVAPFGSGWIVRMPGDSQSEGFEQKFDAISRARRLAVRDHARVRVLTPSGRVESEFGPLGSDREPAGELK